MNRRMVVGAALLASLVWGMEAEAGAPAVELVDPPARLALPLPPGTNRLLRARVVGGSAKAAWLAADGPEAPRLPLDRTADGWVVNLGDPALLKVLEGADRFRIHAELDDGTVIRSVSVSFARARPAVHTVRISAVVGGVSRPLDPGAWIAVRAVERLEARYRGVPPRVVAHAGASAWPFTPHGVDRLALPLDDDRRRAWEAAGVLRFTVEDGPALEVKAIPRRLDLPAPVTFTVRQRRSAPLPGSRGYLSVSLGDVTGGQVAVEVRRADGGAPIHRGSMTEGAVAAFDLEDGRYELTLVRLVNVLVGDDHAVFELRLEGTGEGEKIEALLRRIAASDATFLRGGTRWTGAEAAAHLRRKLAAAPAGSIPTVETFIERIASRSSTTGEPYRIRTPDGRERPAADWLRELAATLDPAP